MPTTPDGIRSARAVDSVAPRRCDHLHMRVPSRWRLVDVVGVDPSDRAVTLALRQRQLAALNSGVSRRFTSAAAMAELLAQSSAERGVAALDERGRLLGWLSGKASGRFGFASSVHHGVVDGVPDPTAVYGYLYAALGSDWRAHGVTVHDVEIPALPPVEEAWFDLGFGRRTCYAVRPTTEALSPRAPGPSIRAADAADLDVIVRLALIEAEFRNAPPVFAQQDPLRWEHFRAAHVALLQAGATHLIASLDSEDVGLLTLERHSPAPLLTPDDSPFIGPTAVVPAARGAGVGRALVSAALERCRREGSDWVGVSFNTANTLSRPFWMGCGFRPTGWKLARRLPDAGSAHDVAGLDRPGDQRGERESG